MSASAPRTTGRPSSTDHGAIERAAFTLFEHQGFEATTMEHIAVAVGVSRRTLFRYFASKNDIPWGRFDDSLRDFRQQLASVPLDVPVADAVQRCVVQFNDFGDDAAPQHRERMRLILQTPALQAHSVLMYGAWRRVIAEYVALRTSTEPSDALPSLVGHVSLALAVTSYEQWLAHPDVGLTEVLQTSFGMLRRYLT
ncbi:MAG: mycofactocin system transcriptional regulator [Aeromicrobium sp.]|uniref:mycofactocin system transcriptional regulator n=1 Tax=Aeromicrobium sp. TaxID=1871063 RepID=UPI0026319CE4|nr:mycofactocin system transcriptional regulator [Aeromicrobium sp.]MDF1706132.1 mycofactocin system transcriptional regulator [Aeromicrobium sp.]